MNDSNAVLADIFVVLGSHNSATASLELSSPISIDQPYWLRPLNCSMVKETVMNWSQTQKLTCLEQVQQGIRYFDLRVAYWQNEIVISHGLYGGE